MDSDDPSGGAANGRATSNKTPGKRAGKWIHAPLLALALGLGLLQMTAPAEAARPDLRRMSCAQAQAMVARNGAVVMTTGRYTYKRFVAGIRWCDRWEAIRPAVAVTRDTPQCVVGYECETPLFRPFERD